jgi:hypothetical protein
MTGFTPDPAWPTIVELATELWGQPNEAQSSRDDIRFGANGSKSVKPSSNIWTDHEAGGGGGYKALWKLARPDQPLPSANGNGQTPPWHNIDVAYDYLDADSTLAFQVVRTITGHPRFLQRRPNGPGKWAWNLKGIRRVPYHLPDLMAAPPGSAVYIPEGEKDVDRLRRHDRLATCNAGGAGKWLADYGGYLRGHHVRVLADNDPPGETHALDIARNLHGIAASVRIIRLPDLPEKGDVSDWLDAGHTVEELDRLADATADYQPPAGASDNPDQPPPEWEAQHPPNEAPDAKQRRQRRIVNVLALVDHIGKTPAWDGVLRFNQLTQNYEIWPPFPPKAGAGNSPRPLHDPHDILLATMYFQANGFPKAGKGVASDAIAAIAHDHAYHPVRDYLDSLRWDGIDRIGRLFQHYFNAEMPDDAGEHDRHVAYLEHISIGFMVGAVARVMDPGCKHDHVPVVVGRDQGLLKSSAIRALCHDPAWFTDNIPSDLADRDTKESLAGKWIIELAEIPHVRKETERLKAFLSSQVDRYRAAYGRVTQDHPRQSAFIGTSNDLEFADVTGNRRFWPFVSAGLIDLDGIVRDRDQLWAEAVALYRQGVRWWLPPNIEQIARERQDAFVESDLWDGVIAEWLHQHPGPFTMEDLFARDTGIKPFRDTVDTQRADEMRAARCLVRLGWHKSRCTLKGKRAVWWRLKRPTGAAIPPDGTP